MRRRALPVLAICVMLSGAACEETSRQLPKYYFDGWVVTDGVPSPDIETKGAGDKPDGLWTKDSDKGPAITIDQPKAPPDVVRGDTMLVKAKITDPDGVMEQSVMVNLKGNQSFKMYKTMEDTFEAKLDVSKITGDHYLWITAIDAKQFKNAALRPFRRDLGPSITFLAPTDGERFKNSASVQVQIRDTVDIQTNTIKVTLGSTALKLKQVSAVKATGSFKYVYQASLVFKDFTPVLTGSQLLTAEATNKNNTRATAIRKFVVDNTGPVIAITSHKASDLIGGTITLSATFTDAAGILDSSVKAVVGKGLDVRVVKLKPGTKAGTYESVFDARLLGVHDLWPVMSFRASDKLGNENHEDIEVGLDNGPPVVELDPPTTYHMAQEKKKVVECSKALDPVGASAANDLWEVPQITEIRARIEDQGNLVPSAKWVPVSLVDNTSVVLYVLDDTSQPLVVDGDGDEWCDQINPKVIPKGSNPTAKQAVPVKLTAVPPVGKADYFYCDTKKCGSPPSACAIWGTEKAAPTKLCQSTKSVVVPNAVGHSAMVPAIYTIPPVVASVAGFKCLGLPFDFLANKIDNGWVCVAVVAKDALGNLGVSPPIRLYVNNDSSFTKAVPTGAAKAMTAPSCTGTMNPKTLDVNPNKPCKWRNPRAGSDPKQKKYVCDPQGTKHGKKWPHMHDQQYCHNQVNLK